MILPRARIAFLLFSLGFLPIAAGAGALAKDQLVGTLGTLNQGTGAAADLPVYLVADELSHDNNAQMVTASGEVDFAYGARTVRADHVTYNLQTQQVTAIGHVELTDKNGDVHRADEVQLDRDMGAGFIRALRSTLADGSRFTAQQAERKAGRYIIMRAATYTPCLPCKKHPGRAPTWELTSDNVTYDQTDKKVTYRDAWLKMWGTPVLYTPYFSHPDGSVKQKSGFLAPSFKMDSHNGASVGSRYYWGFAPDRDATFGAEVYTKQAPRLSGEYRQQFDEGSWVTRGSATYSSRKMRAGDATVRTGDELRGHIESKGLWDMTDHWRSGFQMNLASDDQYFRQYDVTNEDVLENQIYAERFDGRDYLSARMIGFQDLRTSHLRADQPAILPEIQGTFYGAPGGVMGGRWRLDTSFLGLERSGSGADMARASARLGWQGRYVTDFGLVNTLDTSLRGDVYHALDRGGATNDTVQKNKTRILPVANFETSYPLVKHIKNADVTVAPVAAVTLVTSQKQNRIPNEDSQDIQLDASNLFDPSRFPGLDRVEDASRVTYGMRTGITSYDGSNAEAFLGQSYRFQNGNQDFPDNSGLTDQASDIVGRLKVGVRDRFTLDYGFQVVTKDLSSARQEVGTMINLSPVTLNAQYMFARQIDGIGIDESREQTQAKVTYKINDDWSVYSGVTYDLGMDPGLRRLSSGALYEGQCLTAALGMERRLTHDSTGESGSELMLRIGFKNLGTFETSGISLDSNRSTQSTGQTN